MKVGGRVANDNINDITFAVFGSWVHTRRRSDVLYSLAQ